MHWTLTRNEISLSHKITTKNNEKNSKPMSIKSENSPSQWRKSLGEGTAVLGPEEQNKGLMDSKMVIMKMIYGCVSAYDLDCKTEIHV